MVDLIIGAPVFDRAWCLDTWFDSVEANCNPAETGLCFVVPPTDAATRAVIANRSHGFAWCEVLRDRNHTYDRYERKDNLHLSLALARNQLLKVVEHVRPRHYLSWDSDLLIGPGVLQRMLSYEKPVTTIWTWLNRQQPRRVWHYPDYEHRPDYRIEVEAQEPMNATAMQWDRDARRRRIMRAHHLDPRLWARHTREIWRADVVLAFQLMTASAYRVAKYAANPYGEDIPFNWQLHQRGVERWCYGRELGLHLALNRDLAQREIQTPYPQIMDLAQHKPLGATYRADRSADLELIGYYPVR